MANADSAPKDTASDGTPIWNSEDEARDPEEAPNMPLDTEADEDIIPIRPSKPVDSPDAPGSPYCDPGYSRTVKNTKNSFDAKYRTGVDNHGPRVARFTVKADKSGTTKFGISITVEEELKAWIFAKIKASINGNIEKSMTSSFGSQVEVDVAPHSTLNAEYGIWKENVTWKSHYLYTNCHTGQHKTGKAHAPYKEKWRLFYK